MTGWPGYRKEQLEDGAVLYVNTADSGDMLVKVALTPDELAALAAGQPSTRLERLSRLVSEKESLAGQMQDWLELPEGSASHVGMEGLLVGLTAAQRGVIDHVRQQRREDTSRAGDYAFVGVDGRGRPVLRKPSQWGGGVDVWAVLRNGEPSDPAAPVRDIALLLA